MQLTVKVKSKAGQNKIVFTSANSAIVSVTAPATKGKANEAVRKFLAKHFGKSQSSVILIRGEKEREKIFEIA